MTSHVTWWKVFQCLIKPEPCMPERSHSRISVDVIFAEYVKIPARNLWAVVGRAQSPSEIAAVYDPFGNAVHATTKS